MKILVVDDDPELLPLIAFALRQAGYLVLEAAAGAAAVEICRAEQPELVVLDVNLPDFDGFEVCRRIRLEQSMPILMLTVRGEEEDLVRGLDLGADDYLTKPFSPRTLLARIRALLRRGGEAAPALRQGVLKLDLAKSELQIGDGPAHKLTPLELRLLQLLLAHRGEAIATERILRHVWGAKGGGDRQLLKQLVHRLREKIEPEPASPRWLVTSAGFGYRLATGEEA
jgi:DNA-binding response OmpR family regulator